MTIDIWVIGALTTMFFRLVYLRVMGTRPKDWTPLNALLILAFDSLVWPFTVIVSVVIAVLFGTGYGVYIAFTRCRPIMVMTNTVCKMFIVLMDGFVWVRDELIKERPSNG